MVCRLASPCGRGLTENFFEALERKPDGDNLLTSIWVGNNVSAPPEINGSYLWHIVSVTSKLMAFSQK